MYIDLTKCSVVMALPSNVGVGMYAPEEVAGSQDPRSLTVRRQEGRNFKHLVIGAGPLKH